MINRLVTNGCSYMAYHHKGGGTLDLANKLNITSFNSLAKNSVCNNRILRTTLRDLYSTTVPTLYIIGITFVHRYELTVLDNPGIDGRWQSFNGTHNSMNPEYHDQVSLKDLENFSRAWNNIIYDIELFEDLTFRLMSIVDAANRLGHKILVFNTAEHLADYFIEDSKFDILKTKIELIQGLKWKSIPWQFEQGAKWPQEDEVYPENCRHVQPGDHAWLNKFLIKYIDQYKIL